MISYSVSRHLAGARDDVGFKEGYNNWNPYSYWQYGDFTASYCVSASSYWAVEHGGYQFWPGSDFGPKGFASSGSMQRSAIRQGLWRDVWAGKLPAGSIITMRIGSQAHAHTETVLGDNWHPWSGTLRCNVCGLDRSGHSIFVRRIATIGGNTGNMVAFRTRLRQANDWSEGVEGGVVISLDPRVTNVAPQSQVPEIETPKVEESLLTTVRLNQKSRNGRQASARPIPALNCVLLENEGNVKGSVKKGKNRIWMPDDEVAQKGTLRDISPLSKSEEGQGFWAYIDIGHGELGTYKAELA